MDRLQRDFHQQADKKRYQNRLENPFIRPKEIRLAAHIAEVIGDNGNSVLEIGCGEGNNLVYLRQQLPEAEFVGMDFSFSKTCFLKQAIPAAKSVCGDATTLPFSSNRFDLVLGRDLLHHVPADRQEVIAEAYRVLKPGGAAVFLENRGDTWLNKVFSALVPAEKHMQENTRQMLTNLISHYPSHSVCFVEASQLVRALSYPFGWPQGFWRIPVGAALSVAAFWESMFARIAPKGKWSTIMLIVRKQGR